MTEREEEVEVLTCILDAQDIRTLDNTEVRIRISPAQDTAFSCEYGVDLRILYTEAYPYEAPALQIVPIYGDLAPRIVERLEYALRDEAERSVGMAMIYTLVLLAQEHLTSLLTESKVADEEQADRDQTAYEVSSSLRTRGTAVTAENFRRWQKHFVTRMKAMRAKDEEDRLKNLTAKEKDEVKRTASKLTGKQLFEGNRSLDQSDTAITGIAVDSPVYDQTSNRSDSEDALSTFSPSESD